MNGTSLALDGATGPGYQPAAFSATESKVFYDA